MTGARVGGSLLRMAAVLALLGVSGCVGETPPSMSVEPSFYRNLAQGGQLDPAAAQSMISGYRANNGLGAVSIDPDLMKLAEDHSRTMAARDKLDHDVGKAFNQRIRGGRLDAKMVVENVSAGYHTLAEAFSGWRDSPPHRANMLNRNVARIGIAAIYSPKSKYKVFWTLILAAPDGGRG
ncbi:MAG: CAP domain-containing protein [Xanthobacteraceae bacterium]